jgi:ribosome maturation factor RimP
MKKNGGNTVKIVTELVKPIIDELGLILWDVRFEKEGSIWLLRVIIDKVGGVSVDDCEAVSRPLDKKLDEVDPIDQSYCLEVASAGLERELTKPWHFEESIGKMVQLKLIRPYNGEREFVGKLQKFENDAVSIECEDHNYTFLLNDVAYVKLYFEF